MPSVEATAVEATAMGTSAMEEGMSSRKSPIVKSAVGANVPSRSRVRSADRMGCRVPTEPSAIKVVAAAAVHSSRIKTITITNRIRTVSIYTRGDVRLVVVLNRAITPVASPVVPTQA